MTRAIILEVAERHGVDATDLHGPSRLPHLCRARWDAMHRLRDRGLTLARIGRMLNRDPKTVFHGLRRAG